MAKRVSELFDKEVYTLEGKFLGYADDFIFDDQLGSIVAIILAAE
ncbi:MAG: YlmC/YmxH family sporulation protein, partial [Thermoproteota archaeon]